MISILLIYKVLLVAMGGLELYRYSADIYAFPQIQIRPVLRLLLHQTQISDVRLGCKLRLPSSG